MSHSEPGQGDPAASSYVAAQPETPGTQTPRIKTLDSTYLPEIPPHRPAWHDITTAEKVGIIAASVLLPPVGVVWGIVYALALETARRRWGHYALATSSIVLVLGFVGMLLVLAQGQ